ncbi:MAG: RNA polymerase sigma factor [Pseudomonadota bacterium]|nr:RNA polymerase sigma factor [Pseudomonadota bacterium]
MSLHPAPPEALHGARVSAGTLADPLDITALYRRYGDLVLGRCRTLLRNEADAQDALQEVFLKLHRYRDSFRGESSPSTFLFKITTTTCLNRIRTRKRRPEDPVEELPPVVGTDSVLDRLAVRDLVERLLAGQDERTQDCVVYHYVDGMTHDEVGELLGITGAAVRKRISTFRSSLRDAPPPWLEEIDR